MTIIVAKKFHRRCSTGFQKHFLKESLLFIDAEERCLELGIEPYKKSYWQLTVMFSSFIIKTIRVDGPQKVFTVILYFSYLLMDDRAYCVIFIIRDRKSDILRKWLTAFGN